jgi:hypothetical protein
MISQNEMVRLLLSDSNYTIPDIDYSTPKMHQKIIRVRTGIREIQRIVNESVHPEHRLDIVKHLTEAYPGFKITLIPVALRKLNEKLPDFSPAAGGSKKKKRKRKRTLRKRR